MFSAKKLRNASSVDQHDKWNQFGLALHTGVEPFSGKILWIRVWHLNRNPQLILTYYLDVVNNLGFIPLVTQSDPGSENFGIANAQTMLCQWHDPALEGTLQHQWMHSRKNIKLEIMWSQLWHCFTLGFKSLLDHGVHQGWYDIDNTLQRMIVTKATLKHVRELYVDANHPVFDLVPRALNAHLEECYNILGRPAITRFTIWDVYLDLLHAVQDCALLPSLSVSLSTDTEANDSLPLLDGQRDLPLHKTNNGYYYMGRVGGGLSLGAEVFPDEIHVWHLNDLDDAKNEPDVIKGPDVVITEFSDEEGVDNEDDWS
ncbi:hypothetical protein BKA82DRAFT_4009317 [Pisolithus tinctorius]|nr:hypothetical protein BKA82DRAFT_4009317 [Pisolithus tinctorius]